MPPPPLLLLPLLPLFGEGGDFRGVRELSSTVESIFLIEDSFLVFLEEGDGVPGELEGVVRREGDGVAGEESGDVCSLFLERVRFAIASEVGEEVFGAGDSGLGLALRLDLEGVLTDTVVSL